MFKNLDYLTEEGYVKFSQQLAYLTDVKRQKIVQEICDAGDTGESWENETLMLLKMNLSMLDRKIDDLNCLLSNSTILDSQNDCCDKVQIGNWVKIKSAPFGIETFRIVGSAEVNPIQGMISHRSPMGKALIHKGKGESAFLETPMGCYSITVMDIF